VDLGLTDKVFVLTGASRGLGRATAQALTAEGARVVVSGRSSDSISRAAAELGGPERAVGIVADLADVETPPRLMEAAQSNFGRLDGALISVGGPPSGGVLDVTDEQWRQAFESVFLGAVRVGREIGQKLGQDGSLLFVLSISVKAPIPGLATSNGLRPGLAMITEMLAKDLGPKGVRVNALLPGSIDTERIRELDASRGPVEEVRARRVSGIPLGRYGQPEEFARLATFLLSPAASYVSGAMVPIDGAALGLP
jgi:3-oxoacyl-[acyl-carrier protein] reductase